MTKKLLTLFTAMLFLGACQAPASETTESTSVAVDKETVMITDVAGEKELPYQPERVVVYDYGMLDTMDALGLTENVIGTATNNPPAYLADTVAELENVGTLKEPDMEKLITLEPDLIIISARLEDFAPQLEEIAPVLQITVDQADYWASVQGNINTIAEIYGVDAESKLADLETEITELNEKTAKFADQEALLLMLNDGAMSAFSTGSRFGQVFDVFGFQPVDVAIDSSTHGQTVGYEGILEINPDILFVVDRSQAIQADAESQLQLLDNEFIKKTNAAMNDRIITLSPDLWYLSGGGLESVHLMIEEISAALD
ncbi:siderophore ABC transporter substrate-binding protein [Jeotgalibaca sp. A127]|uniref:siderophore ABC transporter substrate-binding protein n=1 Tax=Jeotgalibaca sp. A127 TaxID=3457324 RepID=UPI003FD137D0